MIKPVRLAAEKGASNEQSWIAAEIMGCEFRDARSRTRLGSVLERFGQLYWEHRTAGVPEPLDHQQTGCRRSPAKAHGLRDIDALELGGNGRWSAIGFVRDQILEPSEVQGRQRAEEKD